MFNLVQGPAASHWEGPYLFVSPHCDNKTLAYEFLREFTVSHDTMAEFPDETGNFLNNSAVMKERAASDMEIASLGGQKIIGLLDEIAAASHSMNAYTPSCNIDCDTFMSRVRETAENGTPVEYLYRWTEVYFI